jgi:eukaryotic-like serine/threonine-protein kinase
LEARTLAREQSAKSIFDEAAEIDSPGERAAYVERACGGNLALRFEVEGLLRALDEAGSFLEASPAVDAIESAGPQDEAERLQAIANIEPPSRTDSSFRPMREAPGSTIGPYKLLQTIGEGGMGTVFMAEQEKPFRRKVALKVIKPGLDTGQVIARFEAERQALSIMDHPHVARVLDAGATDTGRPFFVMELIRGVPITEYCDRNHLTPKERLELFIPVCHAIQHAHQKGIIHRDIKPSNVLVTLYDGNPVPKVIDFGVAKAIDQRLTERTMFTEFGQVIGTLEYMSPEQAEVSALDIDTRSDIYSLGVMLYELLTGSTPLQRAKLRQAAYAEVLKRIREEEPTKPSTRLSESREALPSISAQRKTEPARLTKLVRGDLDSIVMKSLEKDRTRRYETADGFARDIQRYLNGDAVEACPPSATYKLKKFALKHRGALATAALFAILLVAATLISTGLAMWANHERIRALKAESAAKKQKGRAEEREQLAIDAVKRYGDVVRETPELKNNPGLAPLRAKLLKEPQEFFKRLRDRLQADEETTPETLARLASASFDLGKLTDEIGDKRDALRAFEESLAIRARIARENPSITMYQGALAGSNHERGILQREMGRSSEAMESYEKARAIWEGLTHDNPSVIDFQHDLAHCYYHIGYLQGLTGRQTEAMASYKRAHAIYERLVKVYSSVTEFQKDLAQIHHAIGKLQVAIDQRTEAMASYKQALAIREQLERENPSVAEFQSDLATSHSYIGYLQSVTGQPLEAMASYKQALAIRRRLTRENPSVTEFQRVLAWSHHSIGLLQNEAGRPAEAMTSYEQARMIRERLAHDNPSVTQLQSDLADSHYQIGNLLRAIGRPAEEALASLEQARVILERLKREHPGSLEFTSGLGATLNDMAMIELDQQKRPKDDAERIQLAIRARAKSLHASAARLYAEALAINPKLGDDRQALHRYSAACAAALSAAGKSKDVPPLDDAAKTKHRKQALEWLRDELVSWSKILENGPAEIKAKIAPTLQHWKDDSDLASIRDDKELTKLTDDERALWKHLWADIDQLQTKATMTK